MIIYFLDRLYIYFILIYLYFNIHLYAMYIICVCTIFDDNISIFKASKYSKIYKLGIYKNSNIQSI